MKRARKHSEIHLTKNDREPLKTHFQVQTFFGILFTSSNNQYVRIAKKTIFKKNILLGMLFSGEEVRDNSETKQNEESQCFIR